MSTINSEKSLIQQLANADLDGFRPEITANVLDLSQPDALPDTDGYCTDGALIPIKRTTDNAYSYDFTFTFFLLKFLKRNGPCDYRINPIKVPQNENINLFVDDSSGDRQYVLSALIQLEDCEECVTEQISPQDEEIDALKQAWKARGCKWPKEFGHLRPEK